MVAGLRGIMPANGRLKFNTCDVTANASYDKRPTHGLSHFDFVLAGFSLSHVPPPY